MTKKHIWGKIVVSGVDIGYRMTKEEWERFRRDVRAKVRTLETYASVYSGDLWVYPCCVDAFTACEIDLDAK